MSASPAEQTPTIRGMRSLLLLIDVAIVAAFVAIGRDTHNEGTALTGIAETAAPFLLALGLGWVATRAWRQPVDVLGGGAVAAITVVAGMLFRRAIFDDGTAFPFVVVATLFLGGGIVGWRMLAGRYARDRVTAAR